MKVLTFTEVESALNKDVTIFMMLLKKQLDKNKTGKKTNHERIPTKEIVDDAKNRLMDYFQTMTNGAPVTDSLLDSLSGLIFCYFGLCLYSLSNNSFELKTLVSMLFDTADQSNNNKKNKDYDSINEIAWKLKPNSDAFWEDDLLERLTLLDEKLNERLS